MTTSEATTTPENTETVAPVAESQETSTSNNEPAEENNGIAQIDIASFFKTDLRVAKIIEAEALPKSKKLLKLQVDVGALGKRQILAGISQHYSAEDLVGQNIVIVANLKPAKLMGQESQGMLLAASAEDDSAVILVQPAGDIAPGSKVG